MNIPSHDSHSSSTMRHSDRELTLITITDNIRRSLDLDTILKTATRQTRQQLEADRVAVYRFNPDWSGEFIAEDVAPGWSSLLELQHSHAEIRRNVSNCSAKDLAYPRSADTWIQSEKEDFLAKGEVYRVRSDIYQAGFSDCYIEVLESYQARAYIIVAIYHQDDLWGLIAAYQNSGPRQWQVDEVNFLIHIGTQLGVAVQQAELLAQTRRQSDHLASTLAELKQTQAQLVQNEKMTSLGQLVAGIAHELNNPINFIAGNLAHVDLYAEDLLALIRTYQATYPEPPETVQTQIEEIELNFLLDDLPKTLSSMKAGAERVSQLVQSLRTFSRIDEAPQKAANLEAGLQSTLLILQYRLRSKLCDREIVVQQDYQSLPLVECYPAQINQVFLNLISNSLDALEECYKQDPHRSEPPTISIKTHQPDADHVAICIADNGPGIPADLRSQIFDPFFTTKEPGKGTGLGLSISYQIVTERHHGRIWCESDLGQGTEFWIELPVRL